MTEREACESIVRFRNCREVLCGNCPLFDGDWDCTDMDEVTLAEMWLRLHPCEKKLVFSKDKFYADEELRMETIELSKRSGWPEKYDGKSKEECLKMGLAVYPEWMEER